jgi:MFS family permease
MAASPAPPPSPPSTPTGHADPATGRLLAEPAFRWYLAGVIATTLAMELQVVAVSWQLFESSHDDMALGMIGLAGALPFMSMVLVGGHAADRHDRRGICLIALAVLIACALGLAAVTATGLAPRRAWVIYLIIVVAGFAKSFLMPARGALGSDVVPRSAIEAATRLRSTVFQIGSMVGRGASGFIYAAGLRLGVGAPFSYLVVAGLLGVSWLAMHQLRPRRSAAAAAPAHASMLASLAGGVRYTLGEPVLLGAMLLDLLGVLFGDAIILLPHFADRIYHVGAPGLGLLRAMPAIGSVFGALVLSHGPPFRHAGRTMLIAVAGFGVSMIGFAVSPGMVSASCCLVLSGAFDIVSVMVRTTLIQVLTPPHLLGRVTSVQQIFVWCSNEIGAFESGVAARWLGLVPSVVAGGGVTLLVTGVTALVNRPLRRLGRIQGDPAEAADLAAERQSSSPIAGSAAS